MPFPVSQNLPMTFRTQLSQNPRGQVGMWICSASPIAAEICAGSGLDFVLIDAEHSPNDLSSILPQLLSTQTYPISTLVRVPYNDELLIKQYLDLGVQNLLVPMVHTVEDAQAAAARVNYPTGIPGQGVRGIGSALARASRWNRVPNYLTTARDTITLIVQIESGVALENMAQIAQVPGVDALFVGPADLAGDLGLLGQAEDPRIIEKVISAIEIGHRAGKPVGTNAFNREIAKRYLAAGADFVLVGADVTSLAQSTQQLAMEYLAD